jgi:Na+/H+-translocating membrane pyrophosphatase
VTGQAPGVTPPTHPIVEMTDADLAAMMVRAVRVTAILGLIISLILLFAMGWQNAALFAVGAAISAASIYEWMRLIRLFNARLDQQKAPRGATLVISLFLLRLVFFAGAIYGSLKCFQGSPIVLVCGLALAIAGLVWEAFRLLRS